MTMSIETLAQATTDGLTSLALVVARTTDKKRTHELLERCAQTLRDTGENDAGADLVGEMARVVGMAKD